MDLLLPLKQPALPSGVFSSAPLPAATPPKDQRNPSLDLNPAVSCLLPSLGQLGSRASAAMGVDVLKRKRESEHIPVFGRRSKEQATSRERRMKTLGLAQLQAAQQAQAQSRKAPSSACSASRVRCPPKPGQESKATATAQRPPRQPGPPGGADQGASRPDTPAAAWPDATQTLNSLLASALLPGPHAADLSAAPLLPLPFPPFLDPAFFPPTPLLARWEEEHRHVDIEPSVPPSRHRGLFFEVFPTFGGFLFSGQVPPPECNAAARALEGGGVRLRCSRWGTPSRPSPPRCPPPCRGRGRSG
eukprot:EG_transcript_9872